ncbi:MAG TPA: IS4 family transposase [Candidatus Sulfotelmatobacter sp.]|nr:IS4 family transposase [Candidatus Sulfotelmatobacter sp.]
MRLSSRQNQSQDSGGSALNRVCSIFSQVLQLFSRLEFESAVRMQRAERHARGFTCWGQFVAMLFCQLGNAQSLREICGGLAASEGKLKHLGLPAAPARSTLAYANEHRPWQLYQTVFQQLLEKCQQVVANAPGKKKRKFRFKNKLLSLDATVIALCVAAFDWAQFRRTKGAVKLHLLLDHEGYLPSFAVVTEGKQHEVRVARQLDFAAGTILVIDRGYTDYEWFAKLTQEGVHLVTRLKDNADYAVVEEREIPQRKGVRRDQVIFFYKLAQAGVDCFFRRVEYYDEEREEVLVFLTNHLSLAAATVAAVYKERWAIELFFKALKQNLRVKTFVGTSENALQTQIWTALIAMLLVKYLQLKATFSWSLSNLVALLRQQLFVYRDLWQWIDSPFQSPPLASPALEQLQLGLA